MKNLVWMVLALALVVPGAAQEQELADPEVLAAQLQQEIAELRELGRRYTQAQGEERLVIDTQQTRKAEVAITLLLSLGAAVERAEEEGRDVAGPRSVAEEALALGARLNREDVVTTSERIAELRAERSTAEPDALLSVERRLTAADAELDQHLMWLEHIAGLRERIGMDPREDYAYLERALTGRAIEMGAQLEVTTDRRQAVEAQLDGADGADLTALRAEQRAIRERLHGTISSLTATVDMMEARGMDASRYQQLLIRATGNVNTDILDRRVAAGLIREGWGNFTKWLSSSAPQFLFNVLVFLLILMMFKFLSRFVGAVVKRAMSVADSKVPALARNMAVSVVSRGVMLVGLLVGLSQLGIEIAPLLAGLGVAGFIIGFALQDSLSNFAAGMMILVYRPFDVGDTVEAGGVSGQVKHMSLVSTTVLTFDNQKLIVPNNKIWGGVIRNKTAELTRRVDLVFSVGDTQDTARVESLLRDIAVAHPAVLETPAPTIKVHAIGESTYDVIVRPWANTEDYWSVYWDITRQVKDRFEAEGIAKPHPKHNVHVVEGVVPNVGA